jgi:hypothetical protein
METVIRALLIPSALVLMPGAASAQPAKDGEKAPVPAQQVPAKVVFASADEVHAPTPTGQPDTIRVKRPAPRVTTCRCGDPQPDQDQQEQ